MMVSERTHYKDVNSEKSLKYAHPLKRYSVLKFELPAMLCYF